MIVWKDVGCLEELPSPVSKFLNIKFWYLEKIVNRWFSNNLLNKHKIIINLKKSSVNLCYENNLIFDEYYWKLILSKSTNYNLQIG